MASNNVGHGQGDRKGPLEPNWVRLLIVREADPRQGDRKGPHPAPHLPRPYNETPLCDTLVVIVRAGEVWSGVGTLAVALWRESVCVTLPALLPSQPHSKGSGREPF